MLSGFSPFLILGYGCYWAWTRLAFQSAVIPIHGDASYVVSVTFVASAVINVLTIVLFIAFEARLKFLRTRHELTLVIASALVTGGTALSVVPTHPAQSGLPLLLLSGVFTGVGTATLVLLLGALFGTLNMRQAALHTSLSWVLASIVYEIVVGLPAMAGAVITILLPLLLGASLLPASRPTFKSNVYAEPALRLKWMPSDAFTALFALFFYSVAFLAIATIFEASGAGALASFGRYSILGGGVLSLLIAAATLLDFPHINIGSTFRPVLPLAVAGLLLIPLFGVGQWETAVSVFGAGQIYLFILAWIVMSGITYRLGISPIRVFGSAQIAFVSAVIVAVPLGSLLSSSASVLSMTSTLVLPLVTSLVLATTALLTLAMHEDAIIGGWGLADAVEDPADSGGSGGGGGGAWVTKCKATAAAHGLSARETEIMIMLAKGRSLPHIQETLHIASGTAHTHARHIYAKLDIHSRQELLDLIESRPTSRN